MTPIPLRMLGFAISLTDATVEFQKCSWGVLSIFLSSAQPNLQYDNTFRL